MISRPRATFNAAGDRELDGFAGWQPGRGRARPADRGADRAAPGTGRDRCARGLLRAAGALRGHRRREAWPANVHFDMGDAAAWSRETFLGTPKHPPLGAWLVRAWFGIFPLTDWSYYLFAMVVATAALWLAWRVARHYLEPEERVVGLALLTLVPFFNFHALKYNANTVMLPLWAAATAAFLRSYETRNILIAALAGLAAAAAMLGKYWLAVLLLGLGLAALADARRAAYFRSAAPWVKLFLLINMGGEAKVLESLL